MLKTWTIVLGVVFVLVGLLGFIPNPLVGMDSLFQTNHAHDLVHLIIGIVLLIVAMGSPANMALWLKIFGVVYLVVAVLGLATEGGLVLGFIQTNTADHWLHVVLGIVLLGLPYVVKDDRVMMPS